MEKILKKIHLKLNRFAVHLKLTQYCKSSILQLKTVKIKTVPTSFYLSHIRVSSIVKGKRPC